MPHNPERYCLGGDVEGMTKTDTTWSMGKPIEVASASYDPGYNEGTLEKTLEVGYVEKASLLRGYCDYGICIGDESDLGKDKA